MKKFFHILCSVLFLCSISLISNAQNEDEFLAFAGLGGEVTVPHHAAFNVGTGDFSVEAWVKIPTDAPNAFIMSKRTTATNGFVFGCLNGKLYVRLAGTDIINTQSNLLINDNKFHHVAAVRQTGKIVYYVDGVSISPTPITAGQNIGTTSGNLYIGAVFAVPILGRLNYKGFLDDVRFWNKALTATEVANNKCGIANPATTANLIGYWKFAEKLDNNGVDTNVITDAAGILGSTTNPFNNGTLTNPGLLTVFRHSRYAWLPLFDANTEVTIEEVEFEQFNGSNVWQGGTNNCFLADNYSSIIAGAPAGTRSMKCVVARPTTNVDAKGECTGRAAIIYVHGAGYADGVVNANISDPNTVNELKKWASRGYVAIAINYRKGWDIGGVSHMFGLPIDICNTNVAPNDPYTFMQATYRMAQDVKAAHAKAITTSSWRVNPNKVFYAGVSTGACAALHATYGVDDMPNYGSPTLGSLMGDMNALVLPSIKSSTNWNNGSNSIVSNLNKVAGVLSLSGAIKNTTWVGNNTNDKIPAVLLHGTCDILVPFCDGKLCNMEYDVSPINGADLNHLEMIGSGQIFDAILTNSATATIPKFKAALFDFEGLGHFYGTLLGGVQVNGLDMPIYLDLVSVVSLYSIMNLSYGNGHVKISPTTDTNISDNIIPYAAGSATLAQSGCGNGSDPCLMDAFYFNKTNTHLSYTVSSTATLSLYPNPTRNHTTLQYNTNTSETATITLLDLSGKTMLINNEYATEGTNEFGINTDQLPAGIYLVRLQTPTQSFTERLVVAR